MVVDSPSRVFFSNIFFKSFYFHEGDNDLKRRAGSWRVLQILVTINGAVWVGIVVPHWLGLGSWGLNSWDLLSILALVTLFCSVFGLVYLHLYDMPKRNHSE